MFQTRKQPRPKTVLVIESDPVRQTEIRDAMAHQKHWTFMFFENAQQCLMELRSVSPLAVFLDLEHFDQKSETRKGFDLIDRFKAEAPDTEILIFAESDNEQWAAEALRHGARDYIVLNAHQYVKMEYELQWLEQVKDREAEDKKFIRGLLWGFAGFVLFILVIVVLYEMGILKEGVENDVLLGP